MCQRRETISAAATWLCISHSNRPKAELMMNSRIDIDSEMIDRVTSRSICDAVGERLQRDLRPDALPLSSHLQQLMDELRRRDQNLQRS